MIFSYDFENDIRSVQPVMDIIKKNEPTLYAVAKEGEAVTNRTAEWIDKTLGIKFDNVLTVTGTTLTVADGSKYSVGMELSPIATADNYIVTAISGNDLTVAKADSEMATPISGEYQISFGGVVEGSTEGTEVFSEGKAVANNTQIFRAQAKLTRTALGTSTYDNSNKMQEQVAGALYDVYHAINRALWKGRKALGSQSTPGKLGGIYQFCSALQVNAEGEAISKDLINAGLKLLADNGGKANTIVCNRAKIAGLSALYEDNIVVQADSNIRGVYVNMIKNPYDGSVLNVIVDDMCPKNDIWIFDASKIEVCPFINGALTDFDSTPSGFDGLKRTVLTELTVKFHNGDQAFASIRNIG